ncbi:MAG: geopeptide radical SAM maturase [Desulfobacterales bacterium]|jgi:uncharacterized protein|nr:geopeptide radical SAM maturase [Desulfobacterales bacterium]
MPLSRYLKIFAGQASPDDLVVFSTRTISKIRVSRETFQRIKAGNVTAAESETLSRLGILVEDTQMEKASVCGMMNRLNTANPDLQIIAVMNLDCNFSCVYCFEGDPEGDRYMTAETADRLIGFIKRRFTAERKRLLVTFYGGEPLLSVPRIEYIAFALKSFAASRKAAFSFNLVTNGSLLTRKVAERLVPLGLTSAKVTLDGPGEVHNRYRPFKSGAASFDVLINNVKAVSDIVKIGIGGNYDQQSWPQFVHLLDFLEANGLTPNVLDGVKFDPILKPANHPHLLAKYQGGCLVPHAPWILEAESVLRKEILKRGYFTPKIQPIMCAIENRSTFVVNYDGGLFKCPAFAGHENFAVGDVGTDGTKADTIYGLDNWKNEECLNCEYLPLCFGGCRYMAFLQNNGAIGTVDCRKSYFDAALETLVRQDINYRKKKKPAE